MITNIICSQGVHEQNNLKIKDNNLEKRVKVTTRYIVKKKKS